HPALTNWTVICFSGFSAAGAAALAAAGGWATGFGAGATIGCPAATGSNGSGGGSARTQSGVPASPTAAASAAGSHFRSFHTGTDPGRVSCRRLMDFPQPCRPQSDAGYPRAADPFPHG